MARQTDLQVYSLPGPARSTSEAFFSINGGSTAAFVGESFADADFTIASGSIAVFASQFTAKTDLSVWGVPGPYAYVDAKPAAGSRLWVIPMSAAISGTISDFDTVIELSMFADLTGDAEPSFVQGAFFTIESGSTTDFQPDVAFTIASGSTTAFRTFTDGDFTILSGSTTDFRGSSSVEIISAGAFTIQAGSVTAFVGGTVIPGDFAIVSGSTTDFQGNALADATFFSEGGSTVQFVSSDDAVFTISAGSTVAFVGFADPGPSTFTISSGSTTAFVGATVTPSSEVTYMRFQMAGEFMRFRFDVDS